MAEDASLVVFVQRLFREGVALLRERPRADEQQRARLRPLLATAFDKYCLDVAGPAIDFDGRIGVAAAEVFASACWFLVSDREPDDELVRVLTMPGRPGTPAQHLSADLLFRYLPAVHRRARGVAADDALTKQLNRLLREWPLSGVLSDVSEGPESPPDFGDHPGLQLLYAERLARNEKPAWGPASSALGQVELIYGRLGKSVPWAIVGEKE
jgi:hypothetical protein